MALGPDEIEALATATATATKTALQGLRAETATVNAVAVKLPIFWSGNPEVWFTQVESCFATELLPARTIGIISRFAMDKNVSVYS